MGRLFDYFDADANDAGLDHVEFAGGGERDIDDSAVDEWSAIGDAEVDMFFVCEIGHLDPGIEGKSAMRGSEFFHVVNFAVGGAASVVRDSVPTGDAGFRFADARRLHRRGNVCRRFFCAPGHQSERREQESERHSPSIARTRMNRASKH